MEVRPGYKQTEVGVIPEDWEISQLSDCGMVLMGQSPPGQSYNHAQIGIALINGPTEFTYKYPIKKQWTSEPTRFCDKGDLLICVRGSSTGRTNYADDVYCIGRGIAAIRANSRNYTAYLSYQIVSSVKGILSSAAGSTFPNIDGKSLRSITVPLPPTLAEQQAIAEALSDADALIEALEQLIAKKRQVKQGAMQELLNGKKRLPGFSGESETRLLGELFHFSGGFSASRDQLTTEGYCYLHYGDIHLSQKTFIDVRSESQNIPKLKIPLNNVSTSSLLNDGDVVFVDASEDVEGTSRHIVVINKDRTPYISGLHTIVAKSKTGELDHLYRRFCFQTTDIQRQFRFFAVGTKVSGISKTNIARVMLPIPSLDEQTAIAVILADMDSEIAALEEKLAKARQVKQGMMQELLTGRIRLV